MGSTTSKPINHLPSFVEKLPHLKSKTVVITGCTSGLGLVAAKTSVQKGVANLLLLNRPSDRATEAEKAIRAEIIGPKKHRVSSVRTGRRKNRQRPKTTTTTNVETIYCDLCDFDSVRNAAKTIRHRYDSIDVLCNNAGIMAVGDTATKDGYDVQMQTNHLSHFLLTKELFPLLRKAAGVRGEARIVNHTSIYRRGRPLDERYFRKNGGNLGGNGNGAKWERYHQSKLANAVFTLALADRLEGCNNGGNNIKALCAAAGFSTTNLQDSSEGMNPVVWLVARLAGQSAEDGTMPLLTTMYGPSLESGTCVWEPLERGRMAGPPAQFELDEKECRDAPSRDALWEASEKACGIEFSIG